jgi:lipoate-protein ligase A
MSDDKDGHAAEHLFASLAIYTDGTTSRAAAMNMAIDEALLEKSTVPSIRFYRWNHQALSFGYFGRFADVASFSNERDVVRRWTGGGIVFHGDDLTYSIVIPVSDPAFGESSISIYAAVHRAIRNALVAVGHAAELAATESARVSEACFTNAVQADVVVGARKVAGAAQRRTRRGLLQQGSIQQIEFGNGLVDQFVGALSAQSRKDPLDWTVMARAEEIADQKYATETWLRRR